MLKLLIYNWNCSSIMNCLTLFVFGTLQRLGLPRILVQYKYFIVLLLLKRNIRPLIKGRICRRACLTFSEKRKSIVYSELA